MPRANETHPTGCAPAPSGGLLRWLAACPALGLCAGLGATVWFLPTPEATVPHLVRASLPESGVQNPVTAVLLNFRGYDTLLELVVLLLTALAAQAVSGTGARRIHSPLADPVLSAFFRVLAPLSMVVAGYVLWVGQHAPGGAFQAGSLLAAVGVLAALTTGFPTASGLARHPLALGIGPLVFCLVGLGTMRGGKAFLQFPVPWAGPLILFIETAATVSIAVVLVTLFLGCLHGPSTQQDSGRTPPESHLLESSSAPSALLPESCEGSVTETGPAPSGSCERDETRGRAGAGPGPERDLAGVPGPRTEPNEAGGASLFAGQGGKP